MAKNITVLELFAGAGGTALGLEQAGIKTTALIENNKDCIKTLNKNRPEWNTVHADIQDIHFHNHRADIVSGGIPCQPFSHAGKRLGMEDIRGTLFYEFARAVEETNPKILVMENVKGLITHDKGRTLKTIIGVLESLGYKIQTQVLNSVNYGVPQKRQRIFIIGTKDGIEYSYPEPQNSVMTVREALIHVPKSKGFTYSEKTRKVMDIVPEGGNWRDLPPKIAEAYMGKSYFSGGGRTGAARRLSWDKPSPTLTTSPMQKLTGFCHPDETRPLTVREYARIQTFPDNWEFCGGVGSQYKQIGNAVPVALAKRIGESLIKSLR